MIGKSKSILLLLAGLIMTVNTQAQWKYDRQINFPANEKKYAVPFLCSVADNGKFYVASSKSTNLKAHDAIWVLNPGDTMMTKVLDFTEKADTMNVRMIIGITNIKNDVLISAKVNPLVWAGGQSCSYYLVDGDTAKSTRYGYAPYLSGWGTYVFGVAATKDSIVVAGTDYTKGLRFYNFTKKAKSAYAAYMGPDNTNEEPGGASDAGFDIIRDVAVNPAGDYFNSNTPIFTSRNSKLTGDLNGGIAVWTGGLQYDKATLAVGAHTGYAALRVTDDNDYLKFGSSIPYGITVDREGTLWVAGIDTTRRWVKGFKVNVGLLSAKATEVAELPSSGKMFDPDPDGAPMTGPCDVAISPDGKTAYVADAWKQCVYKFIKTETDVRTDFRTPADFKLAQNYPNPFNPTTNISYSLPKEAHVRLTVSNMLGQEIATLVDGVVSAGNHTVKFDASKLSNGVYMYTLKAGSISITNKMMLMK